MQEGISAQLQRPPSQDKDSGVPDPFHSLMGLVWYRVSQKPDQDVCNRNEMATRAANHHLFELGFDRLCERAAREKGDLPDRRFPIRVRFCAGEKAEGVVYILDWASIRAWRERALSQTSEVA